MRKLRSFILYGSLISLLLAGCSAAPLPPTVTATPSATLLPSATATLTLTPTLTPSPTATPPVLPGPYHTSLLYPGDSPRTYISEPCQVLHDQWASGGSAPGTVVMAIMFHSITNKTVTSSDQISEYAFRQLMNALHDKGFQAIKMEQLLGFLTNNEKIPERSVLLVVDDRRTAVYYETWFRKYWQDWGWPVVNAWISTDLSTTDLWQQQVLLSNEGMVDYQAHGYQHMPSIGPDSPDSYILQELQKPMDIFQEHFQKKPIAIIWPGGGFTPHAVELARQTGYKLGFTTNPRGPILFNWVPQADEKNPARPSWLAEGPSKDPLLTLPRYWDTDAILHLDQVIQIGQEAADYARQNQSTELAYYASACAAKLGPLP